MNVASEGKTVCPRCQSGHVWRDGLRKEISEPIQRYICRECGYRFSERENIKGPLSSPDRRVCDTKKESKNLTVATVTRATGEISETEKELTEFLFYLRERGNKPVTIERRLRYLKELIKSGAKLDDPESIKKALSKKPWVGKSKNNTADTYTLYLEMIGETWKKPHYQETRKIPFVPTESEIDQLIAGCGPKTATFLQLLKETAMRPGEAAQLSWSDIDFISKTVSITPEKGSNPRIFHISDKLLRMLNKIKGFNYIKDDDRVFQRHLRHIRRGFQRARKRIASKMENPRIQRIMLKTFRTWKATMLYHQTRSEWYVMDFLGHTSLQHTRKYVVLEKALFGSFNDDFVCKVARTVDEAT